MNFREYVDGHIAQMLVAKHREEAENPTAAVRAKVNPILDVMWSRRSMEPNVAEYADAIDDAIDDAIEAAAGKEG